MLLALPQLLLVLFWCSNFLLFLAFLLLALKAMHQIKLQQSRLEIRGGSATVRGKRVDVPLHFQFEGSNDYACFCIVGYLAFIDCQYILFKYYYDRIDHHCFNIIFLELKLMLSASSVSQLIWCGFKGVTRIISKCSVEVYPSASIMNTSFSLLQTATLFQNLLMRLQEAIKYDKMVFLLAMAIQGECRLQSNLFWPMMPMLLRLLVGLLRGPNLTLVRNNFLKWLMFQRYPLVLMTSISFPVKPKGTPQTKGQMMTLFLMFQLQLTSALLVFPILQIYLLLSLMMQKQRFTFYQFQILKLKPPPKRVMFTFFQFQRVQQLQPQPNFLNYIGIFGAFLGGFFQTTLEMGMQQLSTLSHEIYCNLEGDSIKNLQIQLSLFKSSHLAQPKALQRYLPLAMKVECLLLRQTQSPE